MVRRKHAWCEGSLHHGAKDACEMQRSPQRLPYVAPRAAPQLVHAACSWPIEYVDTTESKRVWSIGAIATHGVLAESQHEKPRDSTLQQ